MDEVAPLSERLVTGHIPRCVLVAGATGGIGSAFCDAVVQRLPDVTLLRLARDPGCLRDVCVPTHDIACDIGDESAIAKAIGQIPAQARIDWAFIATGWLHDEKRTPEKTFRNLDADHLLHAYRINAVGPALLLKHLLPRLPRDRRSMIGVLSARVGSISDNRLGGWHAYRASKAALNMLIKNYAIELSRRKPGHVIVGLQPGTTATRLSEPFQRNVPENQLQSPTFTANHLFDFMTGLGGEDSGHLIDFLGQTFEP